jgi:lysyl-tRNA synthetase class 2
MSEEDLRAARLRKVEEAQAGGQNPWPVRFDRTHQAADLEAKYADLPPGESSGEAASVAGRLMTSRTQGKIAFGDLVDGSGKIQLFVSGPILDTFLGFDTGDVIGAIGEVIRTKRGELSVKPSAIVLLAKALRPMPDKWHGVKDVEVRYRQRYLDLISNPEARRIAGIRIAAIRAVRRFFDERGFLEVETPVLHPIPGGAAARPFVTHHNTLDVDLYLRVATELYLKRLVVGGMERVYEIGRTFRNEGISYKHNPEFTMLEAYQAYADYTDIADLLESLVQSVAQEVIGGLELTVDGKTISLDGPWRRVRMTDLVSEVIGEDVSFERSEDDLKAMCKARDIPVNPWWGKGALIAELYEKAVEHTLVQPTIVMDYPLEISPLARTHRDDPNLTERFEIIVAGRELANAFSELNDPIEQRRRFEAQAAARRSGDDEANLIDEDFLTALEYGFPPTGGLGVGIDRLVMLLAGAHSIREVVLFPALRPDQGE